MKDDSRLKRKYITLFRHLNEKQGCVVAAADAQFLGYGGISTLSPVSGLRRPPCTWGSRNWGGANVAPKRVRKRGAGRKRLADRSPAIPTNLLVPQHPQTLEVFLGLGVISGR